MSFEQTFDRIAYALECIADALQPQIVTSSATTVQIEIPSTQTALADAAPVRRPRGRPARITADEKANATPATIVSETPAAPVQPAGAQIVDDFLSPTPPPAKPATLEDLRAALQEYAKKIDASAPGTGMAMARVLLGKHGGGATRLAVAKDVPGGDQGVIEPKDYAAVTAAAIAAAKA